MNYTELDANACNLSAQAEQIHSIFFVLEKACESIKTTNRYKFAVEVSSLYEKASKLSDKLLLVYHRENNYFCTESLEFMFALSCSLESLIQHTLEKLDTSDLDGDCLHILNTIYGAKILAVTLREDFETVLKNSTEIAA
ncbi:hypothetical protein [Glaciecola petra]|uniref:Uncharacterized protein n=1 Tax=Glaciecola petra TaxID=3075602 RepID=A0ABU2ZTX4_9ALTE|nr:hypothetical protein [Aestuariibacter sp. P117]MDT0596097.1 hypothetical protein [Aestuariibacter sp. P117]